MSERRARYAPSPTGPLHLGNLQTALASWLQARIAGASFYLRIEDLDRARCRDEYTARMVDDLQWLGLDWDVGPGRGAPRDYRQGARDALYHDALARLAARGDLFPCACSRRDLADLASAPHGPLGAVYPGTCRDRELPPLASFARSVDDAIRFRCGQSVRAFRDRIHGDVCCDMAREVGDFVVYRRDGVIAYHLAVVVDDIDMGITDVLRGEDLLWSVFPQIELYEAFDCPLPTYWHVPLKCDEFGERMSKRRGGTGLDRLRAIGRSRENVLGMLAFGLGLVDRDSPVSLDELLAELDEDVFVDRIRRRAARGRDGVLEAN